MLNYSVLYCFDFDFFDLIFFSFFEYLLTPILLFVVLCLFPGVSLFVFSPFFFFGLFLSVYFFCDDFLCFFGCFSFCFIW